MWLHKTHGIPLRICRTGSDPGYGYHRLHADWSPSGTACPGDARITQFKNIVFPGIVARASGAGRPSEEDDMDPIDVWAYRNAKEDAASVKAGKGHIPDAYKHLRDTDHNVDRLTAKVDALTKAVATLTALVKKG